MGTVAALLLIVYIPGAVLFRAPVALRAQRARLEAGERLFWAVVLSVVWSCAVTLALAALGIYHVALLLWINGLGAAAAAVLSRFDLRLPGAPRPGPAALLPIALLAIGCWLYLPPSEYVMGGKDPGTYMNEGVQIAQRGALLIRDPVVAAVPARFRDLFFPSHQNPSYHSLRFMGFFIQDPDNGTVVGQFPHLYPASIAIAYGLNGLSGAREAVVAWTLLGLVATYFLGARLIGRAPAFAAVVLLSVNVVTVWFGPYPNAEVVMLALLGAAWLALARALVDRDGFFAPVAGFLLGLLIFLRFDMVLALGGVAAGLMAARLQGLRIQRAFWVTLWPLLLLGAWYLVGPMRAYFAYPVVFTQNLQITALAAGSVTALAAYVWALRHERTRSLVRGAIPAVYVAILVTCAAYAWFVRQPVGRTALHDAMAFRTFAWYVTEPGLALAVFGLVTVALRRFWHDPTWFASVAAFALFFFYKIRIVPEHFWMTRRFLPVILPAALLLLSGGIFWIVGRGGLQSWLVRRRAAVSVPAVAGWTDLARTAVALGLIAPLAWSFWNASRPLAYHVEYAGLIPRLEEIASRFGDNDLVLVESRNASDAHVLALPIAYIYARNVLVLNTPRPDPLALGEFLRWARGRYGSVFFLGGGGTELLSRRVAVEAVSGDRFQVPEYQSAWNAYPTGVRKKEFDYSIYRLVEPGGPTAWQTLDVGTNDDLLVVRFHAKEVHASGMTFRWSRDSSFVSLLGLGADTRTLTIWMGDGGRPTGAPAPEVSVSIDDRVLGTVTVTRDVRPYEFGIPREVTSAAASRDVPARLRLTTSTWNPQRMLGVPDDRDLGVMVERVELKEQIAGDASKGTRTPVLSFEF